MWAKQTKKDKGFTIVELLIVIVVIGILAAITVVAYRGVQSRANDTAIQSDLRNFHNILAQQKAINGTYPAILTSSMGIKFSRGAYGLDFQGLNARYCYNGSTDNYIIYARSKSGNYFRYVGDSGAGSAVDTYGWGICEQIGLTTTNPSQNGLNNTTWDSGWVN
jgi:prepilin-type N-terminal cleavage/methylation domain-containing protein